MAAARVRLCDHDAGEPGVVLRPLGSRRGRPGVTGPQLGRGDHRRRVRSTDRATNGFEPRKRSWYPPTLAWPNEAPLLLLAVQATQQGVDVNERDHPRTGQQRRTAAELDQELARRRTRRPHRPAVHSGLPGRSRSGRNSRTSTRPASHCTRNAATPSPNGREPAKAWSSKMTTTLASQRNQPGRVARFPSLAWCRFQCNPVAASGEFDIHPRGVREQDIKVAGPGHVSALAGFWPVRARTRRAPGRDVPVPQRAAGRGVR